MGARSVTSRSSLALALTLVLPACGSSTPSPVASTVPSSRVAVVSAAPSQPPPSPAPTPTPAAPSPSPTVAPSPTPTTSPRPALKKATTSNAALLAAARRDDAAAYTFDVGKKAAFYLTPDGRSYLAIYKPSGWRASNGVVVALHGHDGWATRELQIWQSYAAKHHLAVITIQWWFGGGEAISDYYTPDELTPIIDTALAFVDAKPGAVLLAGFSRAATNTYALAAQDRAGERWFGLTLANGGGANLDYPPTAAIADGLYGDQPFDDTAWAMYCGKLADGDCTDMALAKTFVTERGGTVKLAIAEANADHGGLFAKGDKVESILDLFDKVAAGAG